MTPERETPAYEAPALRLLGSVQELTQNCAKQLGGPDAVGFRGGPPSVCRSP
jgi:hypothetical protein